MRFIVTERISPGMMLALPIYTTQGDILIRGGNALTERVIAHIKKNEYNGVYIEDEHSEDLIINEIIDTDLKTKMAVTLKDVNGYLRKNIYPDRQIRSLKDGVDEIINCVINNKKLMVNYIDIKVLKDYQYYHAVSTCIFSVIIGFELGLNRLDLYNLGLAGLLHDVGKALIPESIVEKKEQLTSVEEQALKTHAYKGYKYLSGSNNFTSQCCVGVLDHHERYNGTGYPNKKKGQDIYLFGRAVAIASTYDSLTSEKPYQRAISPSNAMEYIMGGSGSLFDPELVQIFSRKVAPYPTGTMVELSNGFLGIVTNNHEDCCIRPQIKVLKQNGEDVQPYYLDLKNDSSAVAVTIQKVSS